MGALLGATREMLGAIEQEDVEKLADAIEARQTILDALCVHKGVVMTDAQRARYDEVADLDKKAGELANELLAKMKHEVRELSARYEGMSRYNQSQYDLSSGLTMDTKR